MREHNFTSQLGNILEEYSQEAQEIVNDVIKETGKKAVTKLKEISPRRRKGAKAYHKTWDVNAEVDAIGDVKIKVWNKKNWQLTHLLEKGHDIVKTRNGSKIKVGRARAIPHISVVEEIINNEIEEDIINALRE